jgi:integrase
VTALERGAPIAAVAKALGHTTVYMTETYAKISDRAAQEAAETAGET